MQGGAIFSVGVRALRLGAKSISNQNEISAVQAKENVISALAQFAPTKEFVLSSLKPVKTMDARWVIRAKVRGNPKSFICKTSIVTEDAITHFKRQYRRQQMMAAFMTSNGLYVPKALSFIEGFNTLVMQDVKGQSVSTWLKTQPSEGEQQRLLLKSGSWLAEFQSQEKRVNGFNPTPQLNWLRTRLGRAPLGASTEAETRYLFRMFQDLEEQAEIARGLPTLRAITHRDFHTGNLVLKRNGWLFGIDFGNDREDEAYRDAFSFLLDAMVRSQLVPNHLSDLEAVLLPFAKGYGATEIDDRVKLFLQRAFSLNEMRNLQDRSNLSSVSRKKWDILRLILSSRKPLV